MTEEDREFYQMVAKGSYINLVATTWGWNAEIITPGLNWYKNISSAYTGEFIHREENGNKYDVVSAKSRWRVLRLARKKLKEVRAYCLRKAIEGEVIDDS